MRFVLLALLVAAFLHVHWRHKRAYHRHRYTHPRSHAAPTLTHRARLAARRLASVRIHITFGTARTA